MCKRCFQKAKANGCDICAQVRGLERGSFATFERGSRGLQVAGFRFEFSRLSESDRWKQDRLKGPCSSESFNYVFELCMQKRPACAQLANDGSSHAQLCHAPSYLRSQIAAWLTASQSKDSFLPPFV